MEVQMTDGLPPVRPAVDDQPIPGVGQVEFPCHCGREIQQGGPDPPRIDRANIVGPVEVVSWNHQNMDGRLWVEVVESKSLIRTPGLPGGDVTAHDAAEDAVRHGALPL